MIQERVICNSGFKKQRSVIQEQENPTLQEGFKKQRMRAANKKRRMQRENKFFVEVKYV